MRLLIDAGNSSLKWCLCDETTNELLQTGNAIRWRESDFVTQLDRQWQPLRDIRSVWLSNVAGESLAQTLQTWLQQRWQLTPQRVTSRASQLGVTNAYPDYHTLGVDRWLALLACHALLPGKDACIIDCGTAITVDGLRRDGSHLGGMILPGPGLMLQSLQTRTRVSAASDTETTKLPGKESLATIHSSSPGHSPPGILMSTDELDQESVFGTSTDACIRRGLTHNGRAYMEHIHSLLQRTLGGDCEFVFTGGYATCYIPYMATKVLHFPDLVLQGLSLVAGEVA